jgi:hypothetical protein
MKALVSFGIALTCSLSVVAQQIASASPAPSISPERPVLLWSLRAPDGRTTNPAPGAREGERSRTPPPPVARTELAKPPGLDKPAPKTFLGHDLFFAQLPNAVRSKVTYVHLALNATARTNPDEGTTVNVDGAILGFRSKRGVDGRGMAELVVRDLGVRAGLDWYGTGVYFMLNGGQELTLGPMLCLKLDHGSDSWALYYRDILVRENLALLTGDEAAAVSIRAGQEGDAAVLRDLKLANGPPSRNPAYVQASGGRIDLARARRDGHPLVRSGSEPSPPPPTIARPPRD